MPDPASEVARKQWSKSGLIASILRAQMDDELIVGDPPADEETSARLAG